MLNTPPIACDVHDVRLAGCTPVPLAHYLKALAVLRLVAEQADPDARGSWQGEVFMLHSRLDEGELIAFLAQRYAPTPVVAPWNGGSGFDLGALGAAVSTLADASAARLGAYRTVIERVLGLMGSLGYQERMPKDGKEVFLEALRAELPDAFLPWVDAAAVLTSDGTRYPPLLGTGGNDGRLDFTNNFMQRLLDVIHPATGQPSLRSAAWLRTSLLGENQGDLPRGTAIGQFHPQAAGGANATTGFSADSVTNPWDFVLMIEGAMCFAAASVKRLGHGERGALAAPFCVRTSAVGYGSASEADVSKSRAELWAPMWQEPATYREIGALMSEGRARLGRRPARDAVDFARALSGLGVDRGVAAFQRFGFQERNGLAYFAVPLGRLKVERKPATDLLMEIDGWLDHMRSKTAAATTPASVRRAQRNLESAIFSLCQASGLTPTAQALGVQRVLVALGACEHALARSGRWRDEADVRPVPPLAPHWLTWSDDGSPELRLAAALASLGGAIGPRSSAFGSGAGSFLPFRAHLEPVNTWMKAGRLQVAWERNPSLDTVWHDGDLVDAMNACMARRLTRAVQAGAAQYPDTARLYAPLSDVQRFMLAQVDMGRLGRLLWGCILVDWPSVTGSPVQLPKDPRPNPGAAYALLKLCFANPPSARVGNMPTRAPHPTPDAQAAELLQVPILPTLHRHAALGQGTQATRLASQRLRASGFATATRAVPLDGPAARRLAASLLFPIAPRDTAFLRALVMRPNEHPEGPARPASAADDIAADA